MDTTTGMGEVPRMPKGFGVGPLSRVVALLLLLLAFVIVPFVLWGEQLDATAPKLLRDQSTRWAVAAIGIALLLTDVVLPIPSSVVSVTLCLLLGPALGGAAVFAGMVGAFALGLLVGRLLPADRLRRWVGADTWDALAARRLPASLLWIAASRPVPVLAEVTALFAGSLRVPYKASMAAAALASLLVASAYALAAWVGMPDGTQDEPAGWSTALLVFSAACLPAASWIAYRWIRGRLPPRGDAFAPKRRSACAVTSSGGHIEALALRFEAAAIARAEWTHEAHLSTGAWHVARFGPAQALERLRTGIRALNDAHGTINSDTGGYHETITRAYVRLIAAFLRGRSAGEDLDASVAALLANPLAARDALLQHYSKALLFSITARRGWVEPDLAPLP